MSDIYALCVYAYTHLQMGIICLYTLSNYSSHICLGDSLYSGIEVHDLNTMPVSAIATDTADMEVDDLINIQGAISKLLCCSYI